jgi:pimeloyl-ACP methyl ester carboxylesterase
MLVQDAAGTPRIASAVLGSVLLQPSWLARLTANRALNRIALAILRWPPMARLQARALGLPSLAMRQRFAADIASADIDGFMRPLDAFVRSCALPSALETITPPVLTVAGAREPSATRDSAQILARAVQKGTSVIVPRADHAYPWKRATEFNRLVLEWLTRGARPNGVAAV